MDIKNMNYIAASGTFTIGTEVNRRSIKHNDIAIPTSLGNFITILEARVGTIETINFQICKTQSGSEERMIINYKVDPETFQNTKTILNISDLNGSESMRYNNLIKEVNL